MMTSRLDGTQGTSTVQWVDPYGVYRTSLSDLVERHVQGRISVIIPCRNSEEFLHQAISSALNQAYESIEVIVVDDASTDRSVSVAASFGDRVTLITRDSQGGACVARNDGLQHASGEFVQFLDADDYLLPEALRSRVGRANSRDIPFGRRLQIDTRLRRTTPHRLRGWGRMPQLEFLAAKGFNTMEPLHLRAALCSVGGFDESLPQAQEKDLHLRLALSGYTFCYRAVDVGVTRIHEGVGRISNVAWGEIDPMRHFNISMHWMSLLPENLDSDERARIEGALCRRVSVSAAHLWRSGHQDLALLYLEQLHQRVPYWRPSGLVSLLGGLDTLAGRRRQLRVTSAAGVVKTARAALADSALRRRAGHRDADSIGGRN